VQPSTALWVRAGEVTSSSDCPSGVYEACNSLGLGLQSVGVHCSVSRCDEQKANYNGG
jgi:hypothetical protein